MKKILILVAMAMGAWGVYAQTNEAGAVSPAPPVSEPGQPAATPAPVPAVTPAPAPAATSAPAPEVTPAPAPAVEAVAAPVTVESVPAETVPEAEQAEFPAETFSLGTRITRFQLETDRKNHFLGHIDELEAVQDSAPTKLYADWWFHRYAGVELSWDRVEARTHNDDPEAISDGNLVAEGPIATLMGRYPNATRVTPQAGVGLAFLTVQFDEEPWWALGYDSPESYEMLGSPSVPRNGKTREMLPDDSAVGTVVMLGADVRLARHWSANLMWRYMDLDVKMGYRTAGEIRPAKDIPLSNMALGAGVKYVF